MSILHAEEGPPREAMIPQDLDPLMKYQTSMRAKLPLYLLQGLDPAPLLGGGWSPMATPVLILGSTKGSSTSHHHDWPRDLMICGVPAPNVLSQVDSHGVCNRWNEPRAAWTSLTRSVLCTR